MKFVFIDLVPNIRRAGKANVKPIRCGPNLFLWSDLNGNLNDIVDKVVQLG